MFPEIRPIWGSAVENKTIKTSFIVVGPMNRRQASIG